MRKETRFLYNSVKDMGQKKMAIISRTNKLMNLETKIMMKRRIKTKMNKMKKMRMLKSILKKKIKNLNQKEKLIKIGLMNRNPTNKMKMIKKNIMKIIKINHKKMEIKSNNTVTKHKIKMIGKMRMKIKARKKIIIRKRDTVAPTIIEGITNDHSILYSLNLHPTL